MPIDINEIIDSANLLIDGANSKFTDGDYNDALQIHNQLMDMLDDAKKHLQRDTPLEFIQLIEFIDFENNCSIVNCLRKLPWDENNLEEDLKELDELIIQGIRLSEKLPHQIDKDRINKRLEALNDIRKDLEKLYNLRISQFRQIIITFIKNKVKNDELDDAYTLQLTKEDLRKLREFTDDAHLTQKILDEFKIIDLDFDDYIMEFKDLITTITTCQDLSPEEKSNLLPPLEFLLGTENAKEYSPRDLKKFDLNKCSTNWWRGYFVNHVKRVEKIIRERRELFEDFLSRGLIVIRENEYYFDRQDNQGISTLIKLPGLKNLASPSGPVSSSSSSSAQVGFVDPRASSARRVPSATSASSALKAPTTMGMFGDENIRNHPQPEWIKKSMRLNEISGIETTPLIFMFYLNFVKKGREFTGYLNDQNFLTEVNNVNNSEILQNVINKGLFSEKVAARKNTLKLIDVITNKEILDTVHGEVVNYLDQQNQLPYKSRHKLDFYKGVLKSINSRLSDLKKLPATELSSDEEESGHRSKRRKT